MNNINFNQTGGFPLDTNVLGFMQNSYHLLSVFGELAGNLSILKGCQQTGSVVSDGVVYINGEVLPFKGGVKGDKVVVKTDKNSLQFENGENYEVEEVRYAAFGISSTCFKWNDFNRIDNLQIISASLAKKVEISKFNKLTQKINELTEKVQIVEKSLPIGLVAIWDRPAKDIPNGWVEHTELSGRVPVGLDEHDTDFNVIGKELGEKTHILTIEEMPSHSHTMSGVMALRGDNYKNTNGKNGDGSTVDATNNTGGDKSHNNIQPSRIVRFIRFVGFN